MIMMKPGDVVMGLDQGPAIVLCNCIISDPCTELQFHENFIVLEECLDNDTWPEEIGWTIKLLLSGEILDVHEDTLHTDFNVEVEQGYPAT